MKRFRDLRGERVVGGVPVVKAEGQRLTYDWDAAVQEWFVNDARGLEHGFTMKERPAAAFNSQPSKLNFLLSTRGTLRPRVSADAQSVAFQDASIKISLIEAELTDPLFRSLRVHLRAPGRPQA